MATSNTSFGANNAPAQSEGFFDKAPTPKPTVTGSRGANAALANLLVALANLGLIVDNTTA